ncbi:hypothetical protein RUM44_002613 [Polyplax serrata]|uniref:Uncharacterized protein n=1 Tax=Polyplax serrata TaxID=468196 RepID=A0ABR1AGS0_POLSC
MKEPEKEERRKGVDGKQNSQTRRRHPPKWEVSENPKRITSSNIPLFHHEIDNLICPRTHSFSGSCERSNFLPESSSDFFFISQRIKGFEFMTERVIDVERDKKIGRITLKQSDLMTKIRR